MPTHPAFLLFFVSLVSSLFITASANSWFIAWIGLEVNLLSFIPLVLKKKSAEVALKYFLVQALASVLIISAISLGPGVAWSFMAVTVALLLKSGAAPSHQWLPAVVEGLSWPLVAVLLTIQKINPLIIIFFALKASTVTWILPVYVVCSSFVGAVGGLTQTSLRKIMAYSAIAHLSWVLAGLLCSSWGWLVYFGFYTFVLVSLVVLLSYGQLMTLNDLTTMNSPYLSFVTNLVMMSLGGLPPFTGFVPKFMLVLQLSATEYSVLLAPLLASTFVSLFMYARVLLTGVVLSSTSSTLGAPVSKVGSALIFLNLAGLVLPPLAVLLT
uniref:NADH-ubiquinone oxidoreductase chain 2 n=1 Tax=Crypturopus tuberculatus TaxID=686701 RepID=A0A1L5BW82_9CRUS|nr:NADH dehydrogenase subunit 2 [Crypturopus tuberculatus]